MNIKSILIIISIALPFAGCKVDSQEQASEISSQASWWLAKGNYYKAKELFIKASDLRPSCAEYHIGIAMASLKVKDLETAGIRYQKALEILEVQSRNDPNRVDDLAMVLVCLGREEGAREEINKAKERFKNNGMINSLSDNFNVLIESWDEFRIDD